MKKSALFFFSLLMVMPVIAGTIYEWRDKETGKLKAGDKPPQGVDYWIEGQRPPNKPAANDCDNCVLPIPYPDNRMPPANPITDKRDATDTERDECLQFAKETIRYKDPASVRVENTPLALSYRDGEKQVWMDVNAKNSFGGYIGSKIVKCKYDKYGILREAVSE